VAGQEVKVNIFKHHHRDFGMVVRSINTREDEDHSDDIAKELYMTKNRVEW
jgi:hypothetical protein